MPSEEGRFTLLKDMLEISGDSFLSIDFKGGPAELAKLVNELVIKY